MRYLKYLFFLFCFLFIIYAVNNKSFRNEDLVYGKIINKENSTITIVDSKTKKIIKVKVNPYVYKTCKETYSTFL